ncbi:hypothetical protein IMZ16_07645 [Cruoricaptor ignavus]|uniref:Uncharacterized protein n=1 Tax=Cruoricaptor ignavus TaxID=1118202 RepID=A0A7M1T0W4_9FLAO|nr:hypothetical protein [Cruoricaptor ignavus]QOR73401.1 hypothetical protein IMZ16_07645 [Cruoricaptor ignavus]
MKKLVLFFALLLSVAVFGQKLRLVSGNLDFLKDVQELNVEFDFSEVAFYKENISESQYIERRKKEISQNKNEAEFERWEKDWRRTKSVQIPEKFLASFNKYQKKMKADTGVKSKYTLKVKTTWIYPGWFAGVMSQPSKVSTLHQFVETANPSKVLAEIECQNALGDNYVGLPNNNDRIAEAYAKTSKELVQFIAKKL